MLLDFLVKYGLAFFLPVLYLLYRKKSSVLSRLYTSSPQLAPAEADSKKPLKSIMQAARDDLAPAKDDPYTTEELKKYDGRDPTKPILVAIKGTVFDVSNKSEVYGPGKSYNIFAGKDGSRGLGLSSLKAEDAVPDYSTLDAKDLKVLDDWHSFFSKRYNIVGKVTDGPIINK